MLTWTASRSHYYANVLRVFISFSVILFSWFGSELSVYKTYNRLFNIILTVFENKLNKYEKFLGALSGELPREETFMNIEVTMKAGRILEFSTRVSVVWQGTCG